MPRNTTANKLRELIQVVRSAKGRTFQDIVDVLNSRRSGDNPTAFSYRRRRANGAMERRLVNPSVIRRHLSLCQELQLISDFEPLALAEIAQDARSQAQINRVIEVQLIELLERRGASIASIRRAIDTTKFSDPSTLFSK